VTPSAVIDVTANQTNPDLVSLAGGVLEFHITNPVIGLNGSGTADAPYIQFHLNTTGQKNIRVRYNVRDLDASADNAIQPLALQYRFDDLAGTNFVNLPGGFIADATDANSATKRPSRNWPSRAFGTSATLSA
jgi:uncharacterized protein